MVQQQTIVESRVSSLSLILTYLGLKWAYLRCMLHLHVIFPVIFREGNDFRDFLFASLEDEVLPKGGILLKERTC